MDSAAAAGSDGAQAVDCADDDGASVGSASSSSAPPTASCGLCGEPDARERCAGCRSVLYCDWACQKAAWSEHKGLCKCLLATHHGGKPVASAREFILEYWRPVFHASFDVGALLPPAEEELSEAATFKRFRGAAMDRTFLDYSTAGSNGERRRLVLATLEQWGTTRDSKPSLADIAVTFVDSLCPVALEVVLDAGAQPGDLTFTGGTLLRRVLSRVATRPYVRSAPVLPATLEMLRLVLVHTQSGDWLVGEPTSMPLGWAALIPDAAVSTAVLDCIVASPGGFPAHAVAATAGVLHKALQQSTVAFVQALLDAGADPNGDTLPDATGVVRKPLHALAAASPSGHGSGSNFDAKLSLLLAAGARFEAVDSVGWTPLFVAVRLERSSAFDALLAAGTRASALRTNISGIRAKYSTVLHELARDNNAAMIQRVLATGVLDVDVRGGPAHFKRTPLHEAATWDAARAVGALLAAGASLAATDADGDDALELAIGFSSLKAARLLIEATPSAGRAHYKRAAVTAMVRCHRAATSAPGDAGAAATLAAAQAVAALFALALRFPFIVRRPASRAAAPAAAATGGGPAAAAAPPPAPPPRDTPRRAAPRPPSLILRTLLSRLGLLVMLAALVSSVSLRLVLAARRRGRAAPTVSTGARRAWAAWGLDWVGSLGGGGRDRGRTAQPAPTAAAAAGPALGQWLNAPPPPPPHDEDAGKLCVPMPPLDQLRIVLLALPKEAYTVSGAITRAFMDGGAMSEVTSGRAMSQPERYVESLKALWSYAEGLTMRSGDIDLSPARLRALAWPALRDSLLDGAKYVAGGRRPAVLGTPLLRRALAATPALLEPLQPSLDRWVFTSYKESTALEAMLVAAALASPYVAIVDGSNMSASDFDAVDYVFVPFPLSNMRMRPSVLRKLKRMLQSHAPALKRHPAKHVFVWGRTVQDAVKTLDYFETMRAFIKKPPLRGSHLLTFEPYRLADGLSRQHAVPYPGIVRYDSLRYLPAAEADALSRASPLDVLDEAGIDTAALADAYGIGRDASRAGARAGVEPEGAAEAAEWAAGAAAAAREAATRAADATTQGFYYSGLAPGGIASPRVAPLRFECDPAKQVAAWKRARRKAAPPGGGGSGGLVAALFGARSDGGGGGGGSGGGSSGDSSSSSGGGGSIARNASGDEDVLLQLGYVPRPHLYAPPGAAAPARAPGGVTRPARVPRMLAGGDRRRPEADGGVGEEEGSEEEEEEAPEEESGEERGRPAGAQPAPEPPEEPELPPEREEEGEGEGEGEGTVRDVAPFLLLDSHGFGPPAGCTQDEAAAVVRAYRPLLASFIGGAIGWSADRTAVLRQLYACAECAIFDAGAFGSNTQHNHFGVVWASRTSVFCVHPTAKTARRGESPSRKGFFDSLLLGCIPVLVDRADPDARGTGAALPFSWAIPWREVALLLPRRVMTRGLVDALRAVPPGEVRARQAKLAEVGRLLQYDWRLLEFKTLVRKAFGRLGGSSARAAVAARTAPPCARDAFDALLATLHRRSGKAGAVPGEHVPHRDATQLAFSEAA